MGQKGDEMSEGMGLLIVFAICGCSLSITMGLREVAKAIRERK